MGDGVLGCQILACSRIHTSAHERSVERLQAKSSSQQSSLCRTHDPSFSSANPKSRCKVFPACPPFWSLTNPKPLAEELEVDPEEAEVGSTAGGYYGRGRGRRELRPLVARRSAAPERRLFPRAKGEHHLLECRNNHKKDDDATKK